MNEGQLFIEGEITPNTTDEVKRQLALSGNNTSLAIHISSPGGSVYDGYKIFHAIKSWAQTSGKPKAIRVVIEGECQSIATFIACVADKGCIEISNPARYMIHNPIQGTKGDANAHRNGADELVMIENEMATVYANRSNVPIDQVKQMMAKETRMTAEEAVQLGFADFISPYLKAVAIGKTMKEEEKTQSTLDKLLIGVDKLLGLNQPIAVTRPAKTAGATPPVPPATPKPGQSPQPPAKMSFDAPLQDGTTLTVDAPNEDSMIGAPASLNGQAAPDGDYVCADGDVITVTGGMVTAVTTSDQQMIADLKAQLAKLAPAVATVEAQTKVIEEVKETAKALATQLTELKLKTVGTEDKPFEGIVPIRKPEASGPQAAAIKQTNMFLAEFMPWLAQYNGANGKNPGLAYPIERSGPQALNSILETNFNYTYPGILTTDIFYKPTLDTPALSDMFIIDQGIQFQKKYNLVTQLSNLLQPYGGCTRVFNNNRQLVTNTTVTTKEFQVSESWCKDDFTGQLTGVYNVLAQEWLKTGNRSFDPSATPISAVIDQVMSDALRRDVFQRVTMGAGSSSSTNYNQIDGLWRRLIDSSGASNYCVVRGGSALGVGTLGAGTALTALEAVYASSNALLKQLISKCTFYVTGSVYDNYINSLIGNGSVSNQQFLNLTAGTGGNTTTGSGINYKGINIVPVRFWDSTLADVNNPLNATTRHLILLTVRDNHILGVENGADLNKIDGWYERKDRKFYYESDMKFGYNYLHCDLQAIAF